MKIRLDKILAGLKYGSRKEVQKLIKENRVKVNNKIINDIRYKITEFDEIEIDDNIVYYKPLIILAINKPKEILSANKDLKYNCITDLLKEPYNRYDFKICGRLDLMTEGLVILSTSGAICHEITSPNKKVKKVYEAILENNITKEELEKLLKPHILYEKNGKYISQALNVKFINSKKVLVSITQGKYHQVRKMFLYLNNKVVNLKRIQIGKLKLGNLKSGEYKEITKEEIL